LVECIAFVQGVFENDHIQEVSCYIKVIAEVVMIDEEISSYLTQKG